MDSIKPHIKELKAKERHYEKVWEKKSDKINKAYKKVSYNAGKWKVMQLPVKWEKAGHQGLDGIVWFRKVVKVPPTWKGKDLKLSLGPIDDDDITWFNGHRVGSTAGWQAKRLYSVPANIVNVGINVIAVRVTDYQGSGGIYGNKTLLKLYTAGESPAQGISIAGEWKYKIALVRHSAPFINNPDMPTVLYNGMIAPIIPYSIRGVIWYQGEANVGHAAQYAQLFPAMIRDWRQKWDEGKFPFYFVQIAPFPYGGNGMMAAALRDAQRRSLRVPNTGMVVTLDIGDTTIIHPANKEAVGRRLSLWALNKVYGRENIVYSGPLFESMTVKGNKAILSFNHTDGGLITKGGGLINFEIAGPDGNFVPANAKIKGNHVVVQSRKVDHPKDVRFCWRDTAITHLFNEAGLPASSFTTKDL